MDTKHTKDTFWNNKSQTHGASQSQCLPKRLARRHVLMKDLFHRPKFPHMARVDPLVLPTIVTYPRFELYLSILSFHHKYTLLSQRSTSLNLGKPLWPSYFTSRLGNRARSHYLFPSSFITRNFFLPTIDGGPSMITEFFFHLVA